MPNPTHPTRSSTTIAIPLLCLLVATILGGTAVSAAPQKDKLTPFAEDVLFHVVLHEIGHGVIREFDLPNLGNEETMADAFATHFVVQFFPDRAFDVIKARTESLLIESREVPQAEWSVKGEHDNDARRAFQIAALAVAADRERFAPIAKEMGMTEKEISKAIDYGSEIHRSWRRILRPVLMPQGSESRKTGLRFDPSCEFATQIREGRLAAEVGVALKRIDWHSKVTVGFEQGDGRAAWSRSTRSVSVFSEYTRRFIRQGEQRSR